MQSIVAMCAGKRFKSLQLSVSRAAVARSLVRWLGLLVAMNRSQGCTVGTNHSLTLRRAQRNNLIRKQRLYLSTDAAVTGCETWSVIS